jgi:hypothetical protein
MITGTYLQVLQPVRVLGRNSRFLCPGATRGIVGQISSICEQCHSEAGIESCGFIYTHLTDARDVTNRTISTMELWKWVKPETVPYLLRRTAKPVSSRQGGAQIIRIPTPDHIHSDHENRFLIAEIFYSFMPLLQQILYKLSQCEPSNA